MHLPHCTLASAGLRRRLRRHRRQSWRPRCAPALALQHGMPLPSCWRVTEDILLLQHGMPLPSYWRVTEDTLLRRAAYTRGGRPLPLSLRLQVEASSAYQGVGIVKLMGRQSGFITVQVGREGSGAQQSGLTLPG